MIPWFITITTVLLSVMWVVWKHLYCSEQLSELRKEHQTNMSKQKQAFEKIEQRLEREYNREQDKKQLRLASDLLPSIDALEKAIQLSQDPSTSKTSLDEGLQMVLRQTKQAFETHNIAPIEFHKGMKFDPNIHESMGFLDDPSVEKGAIASSVRTGWKHKNGILRASMVYLANSSESSESKDKSL